ncbi:UDP-glucose 4-epimerase family protein [Azospirillum picis]|uniref:Nucleoside-diphosphate-sugar epimerase n=1 Tax=Azospirillum picis TaxID=488438 RepID=A0ABU0MJ28_9PROT|nr:SDR family oxidoreductase [Azospirillum picis]MBP2299609.1 nucleoside-diphosphate-sugar epimerase [Azospirillum picis]MDQ0533264.1 nucleoside-diphosphate-sugar epimerase [Azospirillum picis]
MHVLLTGATGFVGRHTAPVLAARGHRVRAAVRTSAGDRRNGPWEEVAAVGDIGPATDWRAALEGIDTVIHMAARVHVMRDRATDPLAAFRHVNTAGTLRLAEQAAAAGVKRLVFLSSVKAMVDESRPAPLDEATPADPHTPYGVSKLEAERGLADIAGRTGMEVVVIRPPLVYGPGAAGNMRALLKLVATGLPLPLGGIHNRRSLIYVGNLADAVLTALEHPDAAGRTFLVQDGEPVSTAELVRAIARALGRPARLLPVPRGLMALAATVTGTRPVFDRLAGTLTVDDRPIRQRLGWRPPHDLASGLRATAEWFNSSRGRAPLP